jgi:phytoene/squalene synthetase
MQTSLSLAAAITRAASSQTYYTIRLLVDRPRVEDAYRAYAYFRWVDDVLDGGAARGSSCAGLRPAERLAFLDRQQALLQACLRGDRPQPACQEETLLVDLLRRSDPDDFELRSYLGQMMRVMAFDARRRGRLITGHELDDYTRSLAIAVTDAMHHFIGHVCGGAPDDADRNRAVTGAHILHMLRDTDADVRAGYFNIPSEVLEAFSIGPGDIRCDAYRAWVRARVREAESHLEAGSAYFGRVTSRRHRLAGLAYIARFRWLIDRLERDGFQIRQTYADVAGPTAKIRMVAFVTMGMLARQRVPAGRDARIAARGSGP